jgi:lipoyl(octanoyl) transferase
VVCEHEPAITVGRAGSPIDVAGQGHALKSRQVDVQWVARGGGAMLHCPGQLAIYPIVPLRWHGFTVGEYLERLLAAVVETLDDLRIPSRIAPGRFGVWGRTGQLAAVGIAVRDGVTRHGAWLNVCPPMGMFRLVDTDPTQGTHMSCLAAERRGHVRMSTTRSTLVPHLARTLGCQRYHLHSGHPYLSRK